MSGNRLFNSILGQRPRLNAFDLSHERKLSMNMGEIVPIMVQSTIPGDRFRANSEVFMRLAPMLAPIMHRVNVYVHYFFVPNRLVWNEWEEFITGGEDGQSIPVFPKLTIDDTTKLQFERGLLPDYMGIPVTDGGGPAITQPLEVSALPFRAYQLIYSEFYRDQNLITAPEIAKAGVVTPQEQSVLVKMRIRAWEKDYFTSCLPWSQRGGEVGMPIDGTFTPEYRSQSRIRNHQNNPPPDGELWSINGELADQLDTQQLNLQNLESPQSIDDLDFKITDLRRAARLQEWLERNARGGSRYIEQIFAHFGVKSSDARLQRPEYLGGGRQPIVISEVLNTTGEDQSTGNNFYPQGNMSGHGISVGQSNQFKKRFEEHGTILGLMSVIPRTCYQQGIERDWLKFDKFDYYWPEFAHIGEQEVINSEVVHDFTDALPNGNEVFGYQSRYSEYKYKQSTVHSDFKGSLNHWHMGRIFAQNPDLNQEFIESDPTHRIFAVTDPQEEKLYVQVFNRVRAIRPIPVFSDPRL